MHRSLALLAAFAVTLAAGAPEKAFRPPAVPLVTSNPYFSVWSMSDTLAGDTTRHWTGKPQPLSSIIRIDGVSYRLMGKDPAGTPALEQTSVTVHPTRSVYTFQGAGVQVELTFASPLLMNDLDLLSRPVTYLKWSVSSVDGIPHTAAIYFDASSMLAVNTPDQTVSASRLRMGPAQVLRTGATSQAILAKSGDDLRIDWGYLYVAAPSPAINSAIVNHREAVARFAAGSDLPDTDDFNFPRAAGKDGPALALRFNFAQVSPNPTSAYAILAYDDLFSIEYLNRHLRPYWRRNGADSSDLVRAALTNPEATIQKCVKFDEALEADLEKSGGHDYVVLGSLAYRQGLAAQELAADVDGTPLLFPKENFSNGCISTVDVLYPQAPQLLLFNTELLKASITPVLEYAALARWRFPFAPHDLGTYPLADGQVYGGGEKTEENQMPVEESANMILLVAAAVKPDASPAYAEKYWTSLEKWAAYLKDKGLDPENQLCTDDFAGHLAHNVNLSAKAIVALGAYAQLCKRTNHVKEGEEYRKIAQQFAGKWVAMAQDSGHYRLTFDEAGSWSQKYNLVWDKLLDLHLFPKLSIEQEAASYRPRLQRYGLPLDSRKTYTKLDWTFWSATLADSKSDFESMIKPMYLWADETPTRVPLTDWYDTVSGKQEAFQARSVVGGVFIRLLAEPGEQAKWNAAKP